MGKSDRNLRKAEPLPEITLPSTAAPQEESLAVTKPHVAPTQIPKAKKKRSKSASALKRQREGIEKGLERAQKLDKRRSSVESKKDLKTRAKLLWKS